MGVVWKTGAWWLSTCRRVWLGIGGAAGAMKADVGLKKEGVACGMGCCSCRALMRGKVLLVRVEADPGKERPLTPTPSPLRIITLPRRDLLRTPPGVPEL